MGRKIRQRNKEDFTPGEIVWVPQSTSALPPVPRESRVNPLLLAALHAVYALDQADDESADPDWAVEVLEGIYDYLGRAKRSVLLREIQKLIDHARKAKWPRDLITMLKKDLKYFAKSD
jgi:hypothetical protein